MLKITVACIISFIFFGWLPIAVGTFEAADAVICGIMGIIIALAGFGIYEIKLLRKEIRALKTKNEKREEQQKE